jgi:hypothetical protein
MVLIMFPKQSNWGGSSISFVTTILLSLRVSSTQLGQTMLIRVANAFEITLYFLHYFIVINKKI